MKKPYASIDLTTRVHNRPAINTTTKNADQSKVVMSLFAPCENQSRIFPTMPRIFDASFFRAAIQPVTNQIAACTSTDASLHLSSYFQPAREPAEVSVLSKAISSQSAIAYALFAALAFRMISMLPYCVVEIGFLRELK